VTCVSTHIVWCIPVYVNQKFPVFIRSVFIVKRQKKLFRKLFLSLFFTFFLCLRSGACLCWLTHFLRDDPGNWVISHPWVVFDPWVADDLLSWKKYNMKKLRNMLYFEAFHLNDSTQSQNSLFFSKTPQERALCIWNL
jgi:hypothetical protein